MPFLKDKYDYYDGYDKDDDHAPSILDTEEDYEYPKQIPYELVDYRAIGRGNYDLVGIYLIDKISQLFAKPYNCAEEGKGPNPEPNKLIIIYEYPEKPSEMEEDYLTTEVDIDVTRDIFYQIKTGRYQSSIIENIGIFEEYFEVLNSLSRNIRNRPFGMYKPLVEMFYYYYHCAHIFLPQILCTEQMPIVEVRFEHLDRRYQTYLPLSTRMTPEIYKVFQRLKGYFEKKSDNVFIPCSLNFLGILEHADERELDMREVNMGSLIKLRHDFTKIFGKNQHKAIIDRFVDDLYRTR